ncbi:unnamed protein product [Porites evermanni]|uniref:Uncharacterized protein n=1 Tax=Porites evermanni TaxID=104178 RepID=A0ABN8MF72_9CNID|nr:unnamed protein product [Porites evermanni]
MDDRDLLIPIEEHPDDDDGHTTQLFQAGSSSTPGPIPNMSVRESLPKFVKDTPSQSRQELIAQNREEIDRHNAEIVANEETANNENEQLEERKSAVGPTSNSVRIQMYSVIKALMLWIAQLKQPVQCSDVKVCDEEQWNAVNKVTNGPKNLAVLTGDRINKGEAAVKMDSEQFGAADCLYNLTLDGNLRACLFLASDLFL